jgi:quercetin dioxygenase-like cupin family protein
MELRRNSKEVPRILLKERSDIASHCGLSSLGRASIMDPMKTLGHFALATFFAVIISQARLSAEETQSTDMRLYPPTTIEWKAGPAAIPPGAKMAVLEGDPTKEGPFVVRFQFPDGYHVPPHTHPKTERVTVITGALYLATGETLDRVNAKKLTAGSFGYWPAGMKHTAWSEGETIIQLHGTGPWQINYVNPADDPRNAKKSP